MATGNRSRGFVVGIVLSFGLVWQVQASDDVDERDENNFREDVILCEEAIGRISQCCPSMSPPSNSCEFLHYEKKDYCGGCDSTLRFSAHDYRTPVLSIRESKGLIDATCSSVECPKVADMLARKHTDAGSYNGTCH
jgi:hypothetical protein